MDAQHGYRKCRLCEKQLISITQDIAIELGNGGQTDAILIDFSKAFDKVSYQWLIQTLISWRIGNSLLKQHNKRLSQEVKIKPLELWHSVFSGDQYCHPHYTLNAWMTLEAKLKLLCACLLTTQYCISTFPEWQSCPIARWESKYQMDSLCPNDTSHCSNRRKKTSTKINK